MIRFFWLSCQDCNKTIEKNILRGNFFLKTKESSNCFRTLNDLVWSFRKIFRRNVKSAGFLDKKSRGILFFRNQNSFLFNFGSCVKVLPFSRIFSIKGENTALYVYRGSFCRKYFFLKQITHLTTLGLRVKKSRTFSESFDRSVRNAF